ncbi:unnamed protein product [Paramecium pentaurelia]|uniref:RBR-type E3 ubiquitin transferase n=1 Tax=Paramecium pentaurelia TaxID=43138 RepID=A0A8S1V9B4_9CILI|nr:unnamed protein product [Paramecium pentaurelia]
MQLQQIIEIDQIQSFIDVIVNDLSEALQISKGDSIFILSQVGWDHIKIGDLFLKYNSIEQVLRNLSLSSQIQNPQINEPNLCSICITNQINVQLSCNHQCCNICLNMHIEEQLKNISFPKCFQFECNHFLPTNFYSQLNQFKNQIKQSFLKNKKKCGNKKCSNLIDSSFTTYFIRCQCGYLNCTLCHNGDHRPLSCAQAQQQYQLFSDLKLNNYAQCPKCLISIEKISGCNKMICKTEIGCGYTFCWICKQTWIQNHKCAKQSSNFERSNIFKKKEFRIANTIPNTFRLKCQKDIQNQQDLEIIQKCFDFLDMADDLSRKETIFISNNPGFKINQFHESFCYERFMYYKKEIFNIFKTSFHPNDGLQDKIYLLSKYHKVANQFLDEYLDQFKQEQNQLQ